MPQVLHALAVTLTFLVADQGPPSFDIDRICKRAQAAADSDATRAGCRQSEESALTELKGKWTRTPEPIRASCHGQTMIGGQPSYVDLIECINLMVSAPRDDGAPAGSVTVPPQFVPK